MCHQSGRYNSKCANNSNTLHAHTHMHIHIYVTDRTNRRNRQKIIVEILTLFSQELVEVVRGKKISNSRGDLNNMMNRIDLISASFPGQPQNVHSFQKHLERLPKLIIYRIIKKVITDLRMKWHRISEQCREEHS